MVKIYPSELQLNKANTSDTEATFLDLYLSISNGIVSTKIYDNVKILILKLSIYQFQMSFALLEHLAMLLTSTLLINC